MDDLWDFFTPSPSQAFEGAKILALIVLTIVEIAVVLGIILFCAGAFNRSEPAKEPSPPAKIEAKK